MQRRGLPLAAWLVLGLSGPAAAAVLHVPADFPTIQAAINAAANADVVRVAPGTYVENINFSGKAITVESENGAIVTIIDGNQANSVVQFVSGEGAGSILRGFTVRNGNGGFSGGGGISVANSSPTITENRVIDNTACNGVGIYVSFGSPVIQNNTISNNVRSGCSGGTGGGGIRIGGGGGGAAQILNNIISNNSIFPFGDGGGISLFDAGTPAIRGNVIKGNTADGRGGGIVLYNQSNPAITDNVISGNVAGVSIGVSGQGGGIFWLAPAGASTVVNNTIVSNNAPDGGSGIFADGFDSGVTVANNIIVPNTGQTAITCGSLNNVDTPTFRNNDVFAPPANRYGGICTDQTGTNGNIAADPLFVNTAAGDYHLTGISPAIDAGTNSAPALPAQDFDGQPRIQDGNGDGIAIVDMGAYEFTPSGFANLSITKSDGLATVIPGQSISYTMVAGNAGPNAVTGASVSDTLPGTITGATWTCVGGGGGSCTANGTGNINDSAVNLPVGATVTYTLSATVSNTAVGTLTNTVTVIPPPNIGDPNPANNTATDSDVVSAACGSPDKPIFPDGRLTTGTIAGNATLWFRAVLTTDRSYSVEVKNTTGDAAAPGTMTVLRGSDVCGASTLVTRDTSDIDPRVTAGARRQSFKTPGADTVYHIKVVNGSMTAIPYSIAVSDTTMYSAAWTTNSTFNTYWDFQNTTNALISGTLTLLDSTGATVQTLAINNIPVGGFFEANTQDLGVVRNRVGNARFTHDGPPAAIQIKADMANFAQNPPFIQSVAFEARREKRK